MWNPKDYIRAKKDIINHFRKKGIDENRIVEYTSLIGVPLIVVLTFISEEFPEQREYCERKIKELKKYYGIR